MHISAHSCVTENTLSLLEAAADDDTKREEDDGRDDAAGAEVVLNISTTVSTAVPEKEKYFHHYVGINIVNTVSTSYTNLCLLTPTDRY